MLSGDGRTVQFDSLDRPVTVTKGAVTTQFRYAPDGSRYLQRTTGIQSTPYPSKTVYYVDKDYERIDWTSTDCEEKTYIGPSVVIYMHNGANRDVRYLHVDRLDSTDSVTTAAAWEYPGDQHSFDAFGKPRGRDFQRTDERLHPDSDYGKTTEHGFTKHEHLDDTYLIHMNGRVYDYQLGRFLSVDPIISNPANSQSINPYSYIGNNPLSGVDPTGYASVDKPPLDTRSFWLNELKYSFSTENFNAGSGVTVQTDAGGGSSKNGGGPAGTPTGNPSAPPDQTNSPPQVGRQTGTPQGTDPGCKSLDCARQKLAALPEQLRRMGEALGDDLAARAEGWNPTESFKTALKVVAGLFTAEQVLGGPQADPGHETAPQEAPAPERRLSPTDPPQRYIGPWTQGDLERAREGRGPIDFVPLENAKGERMPLELHHADQMPGSGIHEVAPGKREHMAPGMHPQPNQGVTPQMRTRDTLLHWKMRGQEMGNLPPEERR